MCVPSLALASLAKPFYAVELGESIASEGTGAYMFVQGQVLTTNGEPVPHAIIDTWEADDQGLYDTQHPNREKADLRGQFKSNEDGRYNFRGVVPTPYPIPFDGPVGVLLDAMNRHPVRPAHLHIRVEVSVERLWHLEDGVDHALVRSGTGFRDTYDVYFP